MYRVMIIDDEQLSRRLLKASINWAELDMEVAGEAASGIEAINVIDDIRPDIAFVDISMPFMNGIEFTELATKRYPELIIIILTAFDDFEYARKCVSLPVFEYILKPIARAEVTEVLRRAREKLGVLTESGVENVQEIEPNTMEQIKKYIQANYTDPKLNLTSVAMTFGFSSSYLSRKFKQETGKNFVEYLTECRMERAMEFASTNAKMFNASSAVGIPDPNYFGRCFKKYAGISYSEYVLQKAKKE